MGLVRGLGIRVSDLPWRRKLPRMEACLPNSFYVPSLQACASTPSACAWVECGMSITAASQCSSPRDLCPSL